MTKTIIAMKTAPKSEPTCRKLTSLRQLPTPCAAKTTLRAVECTVLEVQETKMTCSHGTRRGNASQHGLLNLYLVSSGPASTLTYSEALLGS